MYDPKYKNIVEIRDYFIKITMGLVAGEKFATRMHTTGFRIYDGPIRMSQLQYQDKYRYEKYQRTHG